MEEQNSTKKNILYTLLTVTIAGIIFTIFYFFFIRTPAKSGGGLENSIIGRFLGFPEPKLKEDPLPPPSQEAEEVATTTFPTIEPKLVQLTDFPVSSFAFNTKEDRIIFYKKEGGNMFSYDFSGKIKDKISNITIVGIFDVAWNPAQDRRVVSYLDQETIKSFVHIATSAVALLPQQIKSQSWSPDGKSLAYLAENNTRINLVIADAAGKNQKNIYTTPLRDARIQWVTQDRIIFETAPSGVAEGFVFSFSRNNGNFNKLIKGFGVTSKWSPGGALALVSQTNAQGKNIALSVYDSAGEELFNPNLATFSEKCFWLAVKKAYCAVPRNNQSNITWPDEYLRGEINTADKIVTMDMEKNDVREIFSEENFDISSLMVTKDEKYAVFIDRADGTMWSIKLK